MRFWEKIRRNHGLEHATISLLLPSMRHNSVVAGYSLPSGFLILGEVATEQVVEQANAALKRMRNGERELAVSPFCGTNIVVAAALATLGTAIPLWMGRRGLKALNRAYSNATLALVASRPIGRIVQERLTTSADVEMVRVTRVQRYDVGPATVHWVATSFDD